MNIYLTSSRRLNVFSQVNSNSGMEFCNFHTRWAPTSYKYYKWSSNLYKWPYKWVTGVITLLMGVITPFITDRGPPCTEDSHFRSFFGKIGRWMKIHFSLATLQFEYIAVGENRLTNFAGGHDLLRFAIEWKGHVFTHSTIPKRSWLFESPTLLHPRKKSFNTTSPTVVKPVNGKVMTYRALNKSGGWIRHYFWRGSFFCSTLRGEYLCIDCIYIYIYQSHQVWLHQGLGGGSLGKS